MNHSLLNRLAIVAVVIVSGCNGNVSPRVALTSSATPTTSTTPSQPPGSIAGVILTDAGQPAPGVTVQVYSAATGPTTQSLHIAQAASTTTDATGQFTITSPPPGNDNLEAVLSDSDKVFHANITVSSTQATDLGRLTLQPTGSISGKVTAPGNPTVTNLQGIDVYIPGSSYIAKTDASGNYTISNVAAGTFTLVATQTGLGGGTTGNVKVTPHATATAADLALTLALPTLTGVSPSSATPDIAVTITGTNFGASTGAPFQVTFGGAIGLNPNRADDQTIQVAVPSDAKTGNLVVTVAGISSNGIAFTVVSLIPTPTPTSSTTPVPTATLSPTPSPTPTPTVSPSPSPVPTPLAIVTTIAGSSVRGSVDGTGTAAQFDFLSGSALATDNSGNIYVAQTSINQVRKITSGGVVTTLAPQFSRPMGIAVSSSGNIFISNYDSNTIVKLDTGGAVTTIAGGTVGSADGTGTLAQFYSPLRLALDNAGNLFVSDSNNNRIRKIDTSGVTSTLPGNIRLPGGIAVDGSGNVYVADANDNEIFRFDLGITLRLFAGGSVGSNDGTGTGAQFYTPNAIAVDAHGNLYVADTQNNRIRMITATGVVTTIAGSIAGSADGTGVQAQFNTPIAIAVDGAGNLYVADYNRIRKVELRPVQ